MEFLLSKEGGGRERIEKKRRENTGRSELCNEALPKLIHCALALSVGQARFLLTAGWWNFVLSVCYELPVVDVGFSSIAS